MPILFDDFIEKYKGKKIDFDGAYGGQCVDLYRQYVKEVLNFPQSPGVSGAADIWTTYNKNNFEAIPNTPSGVPSKGDIVIWNKKAGGGFGHVAVFVSGNTSKFQSFDQNWPTLSVCTLTNHNYTNVIGWLHPLTVTTTPPTMPEQLELDKMREERDKNWNLYQDSLKEVEQYKSEAAARKQDYERFIEDLAKKLVLPATSDRNDLLAAIDRLLAVEDQLNAKNKEFDKLKLTYEDEKKDLQKQIDQLRDEVTRQQKQNETLLGRLDDLETQLKQNQEVSKLVNRFTTWIKNLGKK